jgi:gamma-tubulin complex component 3
MFSGATGGALVSLIHTYTSHGDPFIRGFTDQLLEEVSRPFFVTLARWIYEGELYDPFHEFFVDLNVDLKSVQFEQRRKDDLLKATGAADALQMDPDLSQEENPDAHQLWDRKFGFREEMLPAFVSESFGKKVGSVNAFQQFADDWWPFPQIFSTGKSLNFIKYSCHDSDWVSARKTLSTTAGHSLQYSDIAGLEQSIDVAYTTASQRLFEVFIDKFRLLDNLQALKDYLMLGKGDFIELLMDSLGTTLDRPANTLYRHHLTACLETAIRGSSAADDKPDILRRLDARMAEADSDEGEEKVGWQSFMLEFKVDAPLDTILNPDAMAAYNKLFTHLWATKRVELATLAAWQKIMTSARDYARVPGALHAQFCRLLTSRPQTSAPTSTPPASSCPKSSISSASCSTSTTSRSSPAHGRTSKPSSPRSRATSTRSSLPTGRIWTG